jgi:hypothetical protein
MISSYHLQSFKRYRFFKSKATTGLEDLTTAALKFQSFVEIYGANSIIEKNLDVKQCLRIGSLA